MGARSFGLIPAPPPVVQAQKRPQQRGSVRQEPTELVEPHSALATALLVVAAQRRFWCVKKATRPGQESAPPVHCPAPCHPKRHARDADAGLDSSSQHPSCP